LPLSFEQNLQDVQLLHALQGVAPVQVAQCCASSAGVDGNVAAKAPSPTIKTNPIAMTRFFIEPFRWA
jgi:hypothetical protein